MISQILAHLSEPIKPDLVLLLMDQYGPLHQSCTPFSFSSGSSLSFISNFLPLSINLLIPHMLFMTKVDEATSRRGGGKLKSPPSLWGTSWHSIWWYYEELQSLITHVQNSDYFTFNHLSPCFKSPASPSHKHLQTLFWRRWPWDLVSCFYTWPPFISQNKPFLHVAVLCKTVHFHPIGHLCWPKWRVSTFDKTSFKSLKSNLGNWYHCDLLSEVSATAELEGD